MTKKKKSKKKSGTPNDANAPRPKTSRASRPPLVRMQMIDGWLQDQRVKDDGEEHWLDAKVIAVKLDVEHKTALIDLRHMRDSMNRPLDYVAARRGWGYLKDVPRLAIAELTESELTTLFTSELAMQMFRGSPFEVPFRSLVDKIVGESNSGIASELQEKLRSVISFRADPFSSAAFVDPAVINPILRAAMNQEEIRFKHCKADPDAKPIPRHVQPLHLCNYARAWYLFAKDLKRKAPRKFSVVRVSNVETTGKTFTVKKRFNIDKEIKNGVFGGKPVEIQLVFSASVRQFILEREELPDQRTEILPTGELKLRFMAPVAPELIKWVLSWGDDVDVLGPQTLIDDIGKAATIIAERWKAKRAAAQTTQPR